MPRFLLAEPLEVVDLVDRRTHYFAVWSEDDETLGLLGWIDRRLVCWCAEGRQVYEDWRDGTRPEPCVHERLYLAWKERIALDGECAGRKGPAPRVNVAGLCD